MDHLKRRARAAQAGCTGGEAITSQETRTMAVAPLNFETLAWLASLRPRAELTMRIALRDSFDALQVDPVFGARMKLLLDLIDPQPAEMAAIMAEARIIGRAFATRDRAEPRGLQFDAALSDG